VAKLEEGGLRKPHRGHEEVWSWPSVARTGWTAELKITTVKESFAPLPERASKGRVVNYAADLPDYEYISDDDAADPDDAFA
jgi:hypothetical protein